MPKTYLFRPEWYVGKGIEKKIRSLCIGETLNFPCGASRFGNIRADIYSEMRPDVIADLHNPPFKHLSFDTIVCDPPFPFYNDSRIGLGWLYEAARLARKRIIYKSPKFNIKINYRIWKKHYVILEDNRMSFSFLQIFDRVTQPISK